MFEQSEVICHSRTQSRAVLEFRLDDRAQSYLPGVVALEPTRAKRRPSIDHVDAEVSIEEVHLQVITILEIALRGPFQGFALPSANDCFEVSLRPSTANFALDKSGQIF